jgi:transposase
MVVDGFDILKVELMKYSEEMTEQICFGLELGMSVKAVCGMVGISTTTYYNWMKDEEDFQKSVDATQCKVEQLALSAMMMHGERDWRVWAWILERRYPNQWGAKRELEVHHQQQGHSDGTNAVLSMLQQITKKNNSDS